MAAGTETTGSSTIASGPHGLQHVECEFRRMRIELDRQVDQLPYPQALGRCYHRISPAPRVRILEMPRTCGSYSMRRFGNLSSPKSGHTTGGSGRVAWRRGGAVSGRTGCQQNCSPKGQSSFVPSKASKTVCLDKSKQANSLLNQWRNTTCG